MAHKDLTNREMVEDMTIEINYTGVEFKNFIDINILSKKLSAIDKTIKNSIDTLKETRKLKEKKDIVKSIKVDIRRNSLDNVIIIEFVKPIVQEVISGLIVGYFCYLAGKKAGTNNIEYEKEYNIMNKNIPYLNQVINLIQVKDAHSVVEIKTNNESFKITSAENIKIKEKVQQLKDAIEITEYESTFIGVFGKIDNLAKSSLDYFFTPEFTDKKIPLSFENDLTKEELAQIIFDKIKIRAIAQEKNGEVISLDVLDYDIVKRKTMKDY